MATADIDAPASVGGRLVRRMAGFPKLAVRGRTILLVPSERVESWSAEQAERRLSAAADEWPARSMILALSDATFGPDDAVPRAIDHLARAFDRGQLLAVRVPDEMASVRAARPGDAAWDEVPRLSDLLHRDGGEALSREPARGLPASDRGVPGSGGARSNGGDEPTDTWSSFVAFAVVDQDGRPLFGGSRCSVDGSVRTDELVGVGIEVRPIPAIARVELTLEELRRGE